MIPNPGGPLIMDPVGWSQALPEFVRDITVPRLASEPGWRDWTIDLQRANPSLIVPDHRWFGAWVDWASRFLELHEAVS